MSDIENVRPFVLALTIIKSDKPLSDGISANDEVLVCVRNGKINRTHPEVVSVPTQRIPSALAENILAAGTVEGENGDTTIYRGNAVSTQSANGHSEIIYIVESLLSGKLGLADAIEGDKLSFTARLAGNLVGTANYPELADTEHDDHEHLQMLNLLVRIEQGADLFEKCTLSYDHVKWAPIDKFLKMWKDGKDPTIIGFSGKLSFGLCVDGLCISSSADILTALLENQ